MKKLSLVLAFAGALCAQSQPTMVEIRWDPISLPGISFEVYRKVIPPLTDQCPIPIAGYTLLTTTPISGNVYQDLAVEPGVRYCYCATSVRNGERSLPSSTTWILFPVPAPTLKSVLPTVATVKQGSTTVFTAIADPPTTPVTWKLIPQRGEIKPTGPLTAAYTAPILSGVIRGNNIKVTVQASDGVNTAESVVTVRK